MSWDWACDMRADANNGNWRNRRRSIVDGVGVNEMGWVSLNIRNIYDFQVVSVRAISRGRCFA